MKSRFLRNLMVINIIQARAEALYTLIQNVRQRTIQLCMYQRLFTNGEAKKTKR